MWKFAKKNKRKVERTRNKKHIFGTWSKNVKRRRRLFASLHTLRKKWCINAFWKLHNNKIKLSLFQCVTMIHTQHYDVLRLGTPSIGCVLVLFGRLVVWPAVYLLLTILMQIKYSHKTFKCINFNGTSFFSLVVYFMLSHGLLSLCVMCFVFMCECKIPSFYSFHMLMSSIALSQSLSEWNHYCEFQSWIEAHFVRRYIYFTIRHTVQTGAESALCEIAVFALVRHWNKFSRVWQ